MEGDSALYFTPFRARGIRNIMIRALNIIAPKIAFSGDDRPIIFNTDNAPLPDIPAYNVTAIAGMIAKYLATSLAILNVVNAPRS